MNLVLSGWLKLTAALKDHASDVTELLSSQPGELPPELLTEPYVTLSRHTALVIEPPRTGYSKRQCSKSVGIR